MRLYKDYTTAARYHDAGGGWLLLMDGGKTFGVTTDPEEVLALRSQDFLARCDQYCLWDETKDPMVPRLLTRGLMNADNPDQAPWLERCPDAVAFAMIAGIIVGYFDKPGEGQEWLADAYAKPDTVAAEE
jgi:hypothetical protein